MSFKTVDAGRGIQWISGAFELVLSNPGVFLVMALILAALNIVPFATVILGPALMGGMLFAYREQDQGRVPQIPQLFQAFQIPGKIGPMIALCIPGIVAGVIAVVIFFLTIGAALASFGLGGSHHAGAAGLGAGLGALVGVVLMLALSLAAGAMVIFATPRVMFDGLEPFAAMKESLNATIANIGAVLVFALISMVIFCVAAVLFAIPLLGPLIWSFAVSAYSSAAMYLMYKEIFGVAAFAGPELVAQAPLPPAPPSDQPPGPPPPPAG